MDFSKYKINWQFTILLFFTGLLAGIIPFYRAIFDWDSAILYRDLILSYYPAKLVWLKGVLADHSIPRWNPLTFGGMPFYAECNNGPLYLLNFIFLLFPLSKFHVAFSFFIVLHFILIYWGSYFLLRVLTIPAKFAIFLAFLFPWNGAVLSTYSLIDLTAGVLSMPYFFGFWILALQRRKNIYLFAASFTLVISIYGGDPQFSYILALCAVVSGVWRKQYAAVLTLGVLSILVSAPQLLPTVEMVIESSRSTALTKSMLLEWSMHPRRIWEMLYPIFYGNYSPENTFWGSAWMDSETQTPYFFSLYMGVLGIFLPLFCIFTFKNEKRKVALYFCSVVLITLLMMGKFSPIPIYDYLIRFLPIWKMFRYPERLAVWLALLGMIITAKLFIRFLTQVEADKKNTKSYIAVLIFLITCLYLYFSGVPNVGRESIRYTVFLIILLAVLTYFFQYKLLKKNIFSFLILFIGFVDMATFSTKIVWSHSSDLLKSDTYPVLQSILQDVEAQKTRAEAGASLKIYYPDTGALNWNFNKAQSKDNIFLMNLGMIEVLTGNMPAFFGLSSTFGYFSVLPKNLEEMPKLFKPSQKSIDILGVRYIIQRKFEQLPKIIINHNALPYFGFPQEAIIKNDLNTSKEFFQSERFPYKSSIIIPDAAVKDSILEQKNKASLIITKKTGAGMDLRLLNLPNLPTTYLLWNENFDSHWRAYFNGVQVPILKANLWAMAIKIPTQNQKNDGSDILIVRYENNLISYGQILFILWLGLFVLVLFRSLHT